MAITLIFTNCKKQQTLLTTDLNVETNGSVDKSVMNNGDIILTLTPNSVSGQDANVLYFQDHPDQTNSNFNYQNELEIAAWTDQGYTVIRRSLIRFKNLTKVPDTAHVVSAKLYLYGLNSSIEMPQGNSGDNPCYVERVITSWDENTVTWNNQPLITQSNRVVLGPSTSQWGYNAVIDVTLLVKPMIKYPAKNYGFRISLQSESIYRSIGFYTSENTDSHKRPKLVITYN
jgi:hypothetical protein